MKNKSLGGVLLSGLLLCSSSCGWTPTLLESGIAGGAAGAGVGALVGAALPRGLIAKSAGLGGLIGVPAGLALGALYIQRLEARKIEEQRDKVFEQQQEIFQTEREIEEMRQEILADAPKHLDQSRKRIYYDGPTHGNFYR